MPLLRRLDAEAVGAQPIKRLVVVVMGNGFEQYAYAAAPGKALTSTPMLTPVAAYEQRLLVVSGLANPFGQQLHGNGFASTSVVVPIHPDKNPGGISLDRYVASTLGASDPFHSINLAGIYHDDDAIHRSSDGAGAVFPAVYDPVKAYADLFGAAAGSTSSGQMSDLLARDQSVLDFAVEDAARLSSRLSGYEKEKIEQYASNLRALERQLQDAQQARLDCADVPKPTTSIQGEPRINLALDEVIEAHVALVAQSLGCGLTRVAALNLGNSCGEISHYGVAHLKNDGSHHQYCHDGNWAAMMEIQSYFFQKIASLMARLEQVPEGDGSMLDNTVVLIVNDGGGSHHDGFNSIPILLFNGPVASRGKHVAYDYQEHTPSDMYVSVLNTLGLPDTTFGDPNVCKGALAEIG